MISKNEAWQKVLNIRKITYGWCEEEKNKYLFDLTLEIDAKLVVEIGIYRGLSLCSFSAASLVNNCKVVGIDSFLNDSIAYVTQEELDKSKKIIQENFKNEKLPCQFIFKSSLEANFNNDFKEESIDILHIDASHTPENSCLDVFLWLPKLKKHGYLILDDANWDSLKYAIKLASKYCNHVCYLEINNKTQVLQKR